MEFLTLLIAYKDVIFDFLFALHALCLVVVNVTATPKDNAVLSKIYKVLEVAAGLVSRKAKT